jgi:hypothetical protein
VSQSTGSEGSSESGGFGSEEGTDGSGFGSEPVSDSGESAGSEDPHGGDAGEFDGEGESGSQHGN